MRSSGTRKDKGIICSILENFFVTGLRSSLASETSQVSEFRVPRAALQMSEIVTVT